jgi:c-di-AMP phosphodiesterase-like protein
MKTYTQILDTKVDTRMIDATYKVTLTLKYSDTCAIHQMLKDQAEEYKKMAELIEGEDNKKAFVNAASRMETAAKAFDVQPLIEKGFLKIGKPVAMDAN